MNIGDISNQDISLEPGAITRSDDRCPGDPSGIQPGSAVHVGVGGRAARYCCRKASKGMVSAAFILDKAGKTRVSGGQNSALLRENPHPEPVSSRHIRLRLKLEQGHNREFISHTNVC
jgi:hypothetical protein